MVNLVSHKNVKGQSLQQTGSTIGSLCELTLNFYYDHFDQTYIGLMLAQIIHGFMMLDAGYSQRKS